MSEELNISTAEINPQAVDPKQGDIELSNRLDRIGMKVLPEIVATWSVEEMTEALEYVDSFEAAEMFDDELPKPPKVLDGIPIGEPETAEEEAPIDTSRETESATQISEANGEDNGENSERHGRDTFTKSNGENSEETLNQDQIIPDDTEQAYNQLLFAVGYYLQAHQYAEAARQELERRRAALVMLFTGAHSEQPEEVEPAPAQSTVADALPPETPISALTELPPRVRKALMANDCQTVGDLKTACESKMIESFDRIGPAALDKIREVLGLSLS